MSSTKTPRTPSNKPNSDVQEVVVSAPRPKKPSKFKQWSDSYTAATRENPGKKLTADMIPFLGTATGIADTLNDAYRGDYINLPLDVAGIIPGARYLTRGLDAAKAARAAGNSVFDAVRNMPLEHHMIRVNEGAARTLDNAQDVSQAKDNTEKKYARGGLIKPRDGIAQRGKTKGRMR